MAHNIQFKNLESNKLEYINGVDDAICAYLGRPSHPKEWCENWWNSVGMMLAGGISPEQMRVDLMDWAADDDPDQVTHYTTLLSILNFVVMTYDVITFRTWGFAR